MSTHRPDIGRMFLLSLTPTCQIDRFLLNLRSPITPTAPSIARTCRDCGPDPNLFDPYKCFVTTIGTRCESCQKLVVSGGHKQPICFLNRARSEKVLDIPRREI